MSIKVLVTFASRAGSTAEIADVIAEQMLRSGCDADLQKMNRVVTLRPYDAVVLGAPLYAGHFPGEVRGFLLRHREPLSRLRPWLFALGPTRPEPDDYQAARRQALDELAQYSWFRPAELKIFGGRLSIEHLPFPYNLFRRMKDFPLKACDQRNWTEIRAWAQEAAGRLGVSALLFERPSNAMAVLAQTPKH